MVRAAEWARQPCSLRAARECEFSASVGSPEGRELVHTLGADQVFDHTDPGYRQGILDATDGRGVDCILEMLANVNLGEDLRLLAPRGRVVVIGSRGNVESNPRDAMMRDADIRGMILGNALPDGTRGNLQISRRTPRGRPHSAHHRKRASRLASAAEAHRAVMSKGPRRSRRAGSVAYSVTRRW